MIAAWECWLDQKRLIAGWKSETNTSGTYDYPEVKAPLHVLGIGKAIFAYETLGSQFTQYKEKLRDTVSPLLPYVSINIRVTHGLASRFLVEWLLFTCILTDFLCPCRSSVYKSVYSGTTHTRSIIQCAGTASTRRMHPICSGKRSGKSLVDAATCSGLVRPKWTACVKVVAASILTLPQGLFVGEDEFQTELNSKVNVQTLAAAVQQQQQSDV